ncbi:Uncharacterised protein [Bordetella pertussis]|nr:Uncharacterised protein [Bordetella pertussis]CFW45412.1 Uncharacterised protein [Bordetella pertussis]
MANSSNRLIAIAQVNMASGCFMNRRRPSRTHCQPEIAGRDTACIGFATNGRGQNTQPTLCGCLRFGQVGGRMAVARLQHSFEVPRIVRLEGLGRTGQVEIVQA